MRLMPQSIIRSFQSSKKKHVLITGSRGSGKSTLAGRLGKLLAPGEEGLPFPGITTSAVAGQAVILEENATGRQAVIGRYVRPADGNGSAGGCMQSIMDGLEGLGRQALMRCAAGEAYAGAGIGEWVMLDELGYLESGCEGFLSAVRLLFEKKRVLAVLRKQHTPFLDELRVREDVFVYDLDEPVLPVGCILMASGLGRRFGGNKLLAWLGERTLLEHALEQTEGVFARRVVVTRYPEIGAICQAQGIACVIHDRPNRNDTVRIGMEYLQRWPEEGREAEEALAGYLFCPADQPLLRRESVETLVLDFSRAGRAEGIFRLASQGKAGAPVLFGSAYREALKSLPQGKGGSWLVQKYPQNVYFVEAGREELWDVDTPEELEACEKQ